jgi:plasmid stabilization system protein ParE
LTALSRRAERQFDALVRHYERLGRVEAIQNLVAAVEQAGDMIAADPKGGLPAPRPYPDLIAPRRAWVKAGRYWIAYRTTTPPIVTGIFFETADIPTRL